LDLLPQEMSVKLLYRELCDISFTPHLPIHYKVVHFDR